MMRDEQTRLILIALTSLSLTTSIISATTMWYVIKRKFKITREPKIDNVSMSTKSTFENPNERKQRSESSYTHQLNKKSRKVPTLQAPNPSNSKKENLKYNKPLRPPKPPRTCKEPYRNRRQREKTCKAEMHEMMDIQQDSEEIYASATTRQQRTTSHNYEEPFVI